MKNIEEYDIEDLNNLKIQLSDEDEKMLEEIANLTSNMPQDKDLLSELIEASLKGLMNYIDSFIDITAIGDYSKNPLSIQNNDNEKIKIKRNNEHNNQEIEAVENKDDTSKSRTIRNARISPYAPYAAKDNSGMSEEGIKRLRQYESEYQNRIKTVDKHSKNYKTNDDDNFKSLSGLESYKFGPTIPLYTANEYKERYKAAGSPEEKNEWIRQENYDHFDREMAKEFGFKNKTQFRKWRKNNKLAPHEGPNGMFLVPGDVHDFELHSGWVSKIQQFLNGEITNKDLDEWKQKAKIERIKQETYVRGQRAVKGAAISIGKDLIVFFAQETKVEFINNENKKCSFFEHIKNIIQNWCNRIKKEWKSLTQKMGENVVGTLATEAMNAIVDFFLHSFKNVAKMIRVMLNSILRALRVIFDSKQNWEDRLFEAIKIISAGMVAFLGVGLNETIKNFIATIFPQIASVAPYIADALSGFISCIMSSIVLCMFDRYKAQLQITSARLKEDLLNTRLIYVNTSLALVSSLQAGKSVQTTVSFFVTSVNEMGTKRVNIEKNLETASTNVQKTNDNNVNTRNSIINMLNDND